MSNKTFQRTGSLHPKRSAFDLSYEKKFPAEVGQLIPIMHDEVYPGDTFKISNEIIVRMSPMISPILHELNAYVHYFFVPYRLLWDDWENFITGGSDGTFETTIPLAPWNPDLTDPSGNTFTLGSLWDYFGYPRYNPVGAYPIAFPHNAYNFIYNEYYRDINWQQLVPLNNDTILYRNWEKDYFTSATPSQQRGVPPAFPLAGTLNVDPTGVTVVSSPFSSSPSIIDLGVNAAAPGTGQFALDTTDQTAGSYLRSALKGQTVDLTNALTFDVSDLRRITAVQVWMERNMRAGYRYTDVIRSHFGKTAPDFRLQRPEYIGGSKTPIIISEVLQTSNSPDPSSSEQTTPQGNLAGHGLAADRQRIAKYNVVEHGIIMGIMSIMPRLQYQSQGINRQWLRRSRFDFMWPEFVNLSEQAILGVELASAPTTLTNNRIIGFTGMYDELRTKQSMVCGLFRSDVNQNLAHWHLSRSISPGTLINQNFITTRNFRKDYLEVPSQPAFMVQASNLILAFRPIPIMSRPGLTDHHN